MCFSTLFLLLTFGVRLVYLVNNAVRNLCDWDFWKLLLCSCKMVSSAKMNVRNHTDQSLCKTAIACLCQEHTDSQR